MTHPASGLDDVVHQRARLGILAVVVESRRVDFAFLRATLELTDGNLSRHLQVLENAGYITIDKVFEARRPRTWIQPTPAGREAFDTEVNQLQALITRARPAERPS